MQRSNFKPYEDVVMKLRSKNIWPLVGIALSLVLVLHAFCYTHQSLVEGGTLAPRSSIQGLVGENLFPEEQETEQLFSLNAWPEDFLAAILFSKDPFHFGIQKSPFHRQLFSRRC